MEAKLESATPDKLAALLEELQKRFAFPIDLARREDFPIEPSELLAGGADVMFHQDQNAISCSFAATSLSVGKDVIRCGPFPSLKNRTESLTTTIVVILLPPAFAVAHLLRPVAKQFRCVENDLVETTKDGEERKHRLQSFGAATEELDQLVGELVSYVRMDTAELQLNREHIAVYDLRDDVIPKFASLHQLVEF